MNADEFNRLKYQGYLYAASVIEAAPKDLSPSHSCVKNCLEILYCVSGEEEIVVDGKSHKVVPGIVRIAPPKEKCSEHVMIRTVSHVTYIDIGFVTLDPFVDKNIFLDAGGNRKIDELMAKILNICNGKYENWFFEATSVFWLIIKELRILMNRSGNREITLDKKLKPAIRYIHENYRDRDFDFSLLPELCGFKNNYFHKIFQQRYKTTPVKYVSNLRMQLAAEYISLGGKNISEIAEYVGYDSVAYFSRVFKNFYGVVPSKYSNERYLEYADYL